MHYGNQPAKLMKIRQWAQNRKLLTLHFHIVQQEISASPSEAGYSVFCIEGKKCSDQDVSSAEDENPCSIARLALNLDSVISCYEKLNWPESLSHLVSLLKMILYIEGGILSLVLKCVSLYLST